MTCLTKLSFIGFIIAAATDIINYISFYCGYKWLFLDAVFNFCFMENHWLFAAHYLHVASLFRLLFARHSESELKLMQSRNRWLWILFVGFSVLLAATSIGFFYFEGMSWIHVIFWWIMVACYWTIALVNLFSMRHIYLR